MKASTITRRMEEIFTGLDNEFKSLYFARDFESKLAELELAGNRSNRASILAELFDMLDACAVEYEKGRDNAYYADLVKNMFEQGYDEGEDRAMRGYDDIEDRVLFMMYTRFREYPSPENYMKRIVDRMSSTDDGWENDTLRLRILKQFIKYGNFLADAGYGGGKVISDHVKEKLGKKPNVDEILELLDDSVFDVLENATKDQKKSGGKYGLIKLSDDLALGKFRMGNSTKQGLYLLAMVYFMTYCASDDDKEQERLFDSDIEKNLFHDYYANNLVRFLSDSYINSASDFELDPSGQGINYKNFAEVIYIYYISKELEPTEKIKRASEMIKRVKERGNREAEKKNAVKASNPTVFYKSAVRGGINGYDTESILKLDESGFEDFICENFDLRTDLPATETKKARTVGDMQVACEQNTAFAKYNEILELLNDTGVSMKDLNTGLSFIDVNEIKKNGVDSIIERYDKYAEDYGKVSGRKYDRVMFSVFMNLLNRTDEFLGKPREITDPEAVTRTAMISAYYHLYNVEREAEYGDDITSFAEVFDDFKSSVDPYLVESGYQPLSGKNLFDVMVAFSAYSYLNV